MTWNEIRKWASDKGYKASKAKEGYAWHLETDPNVRGVAKSVNKLAKAIFNHLSNNKWLDHQKSYE